MNYDYSNGVDNATLQQVQTMPNLDGLSVWYQKTHKPTWWTAWQALTQASNLMLTSDFLTRFYAYNAFFYVFNDQSMVDAGVLASLSPADRATVYSDPFVGMDSVSKLAFWVAANIEGPTSAYWTTIVDYYAAKGIDLSSAMYQICGTESILQFVTKNEASVLLNTARFNQKVKLNAQQMAQIQWGQNILSDPLLFLDGLPTLDSIAGPSFDDTILYPIEFGSYVMMNNMSDLILNTTQIFSILEASTDSYTTLLNPDNMRAFYKQYGEGGYANIYQRFGFNSQA